MVTLEEIAAVLELAARSPKTKGEQIFLESFADKINAQIADEQKAQASEQSDVRVDDHPGPRR